MSRVRVRKGMKMVRTSTKPFAQLALKRTRLLFTHMFVMGLVALIDRSEITFK